MYKHIRQFCNQKGLTLIEVVIAMFVLSIMVLTLTALFTSSFSGIFTAGRRSSTQFLVQEEVERAITGDSDADAVFTPVESIEGIPGTIVEVEQEYEDGRTVKIKTFYRNQPVWIQFSTDQHIAPIGSGTAEIKISRKGITGSPASVTYNTAIFPEAENDAINGIHFVLNTPGELNFAADETQKSLIVELPAFPSDGNNYSVYLVLSDANAESHNALLGTPSKIPLHLIDMPEDEENGENGGDE
ncbi:prepilin-type N-terminal cleavage/methylation domain-containing protein [Dethiobacter alkaliphilus]|uniref:prepilin-type N-terminal cleavage/methylation domain-containing protein n=1 Tax=Dethiobacter alkaliphilus TaxID=427926 RepID=UPI002227B826|nr:prepilin-type N-terminal cleavage/methylation domain-containing protein [Dethiobacter alkaliphilus]MCW3490305.1 prepilin-type N-terminal cleavage/methylation domain-containing protein [Dethiobacter alkaliphilus]